MDKTSIYNETSCDNLCLLLFLCESISVLKQMRIPQQQRVPAIFILVATYMESHTFKESILGASSMPFKLKEVGLNRL